MIEMLDRVGVPGALDAHIVAAKDLPVARFVELQRFRSNALESRQGCGTALSVAQA